MLRRVDATPGNAVVGVLPLLIAAIWVGTSALSAQLSGWSRLAEVYSSSMPFTGQSWRLQSVQMRWSMHYNTCVTVGASPQGLALSMFIFMRPGHGPLFIPWPEVSATRTRVFLRTLVELRFQRAPGIPLRISPRLSARLAAASGGVFRAPTPAA